MIEWNKNKQIQNHIFDTIGNTPLLRLARIPKAEGVDANILGKLEWYSPSGSLKDRIYYEMFTAAEKRGELRPGMTVLECSTGNAGISCSFVAAVKGYKCIIVMPEGMSEERKKLDLAYGAEMVYTPGGESDVDLALQKVQEIKSQNPEQYWEPGQFSNPDNVVAHYNTTGPEIWEQTDGQVDAFIVTQGTGGTITGVGRYLRERKPDVLLFAVEPAECPLLSKRRWGSHKIEGIGDGFVPRDLDISILSGIITTSSKEAIAMAKRMSVEEGLFCGISSGSNLAACIKFANRHPEVKNIVTMINDSGQRYFSTELCGEPKHFDVPTREHPIDDYSLEQLKKYSGEWEIIE